MTTRRYWVVESRNAASPTCLWYLTFGVFGGFGPNPEAMTCFPRSRPGARDQILRSRFRACIHDQKNQRLTADAPMA